MAETNGGTSGIQENLAGALTYLFGWITGLIFFLIDKRPSVRFNAMQSIILSVATMIVYFILFLIPVLGLILGILVWIAFFVLWLVLIVRTYQGKTWKLPVIGGLAEKWSK